MSHAHMPISTELRDELLVILERMRSSKPKDHAKPFTATLVALMSGSIEYMMIEPLERAKVGGVGIRVAKFGVNTANKGLSAAVKQLTKGLSNDQLLIIGDFVEELVTPPPSLFEN